MIRRRGCLKGFNHLSFVHFEERKGKWVRYGKTPLSYNNDYFYFLLLINSQNDVVLGKTYCAVLERKGLAQFFF
jgi:hypothetical protein